ncbi:hypothetical protein K402DRAFT_339402, partial [Aulographum hederae CBS 113979]
MSSPLTPPLAFDGHCSVIDSNTLYVYSPDGLQSLPLKEGGNWTVLDPGVSVSGARCVQGGNGAQSALYVVGGYTNDSVTDYHGLQKYTFSARRWESIEPESPVTQRRQYHGATYINSTSQILVYAGSQSSADFGLSSETFLISTTPPYTVLAYVSNAPPLSNPLLMPWNDSHALMVGGSVGNSRIFTFGQEEGFADLGTSLTSPIMDQSSTQVALVTGDDNSKVLEMFDLGATPNTVDRIVLWEAGRPAQPGQEVGAPPAPSSSPRPQSRKRKRRMSKRAALTIDSWPTYNDTFAPDVRRQGFSVAQNPSGLAVVSGGAAQDPIAVFNLRQNTWMNNSEIFGGQQVIVNSVSSASPTATSMPTSSPSSTASSAPTPETFAGGGPRSKSHVLTVLGATLGTIFGLAALLIIILLLLRWKREKRKRQQHDNYRNEKEDRLSFADQGTEFMHTAGGSVGHKYTASMNGSISSMNIMTGKVNSSNADRRLSHKRAMGAGVGGSDASTAGLIKKPSPLGYHDPVIMERIQGSPELFPPTKPEPAQIARKAPSRSSGWSRYFNNNEATNLAAMPTGGHTTYATTDSQSRGPQDSQYSLASTSAYSSSAPKSSLPRPLELNLGPKFDGQKISSVSGGSPSIGRSTEDFTASMSAELRRVGSQSTRTSEPGSIDEYTFSSRGNYGEGTVSWTPMHDERFDSTPSPPESGNNGNESRNG